MTDVVTNINVILCYLHSKASMHIICFADKSEH